MTGMLEQMQSGVAQTVILPMEYRAVMKDGSAPARPQEDAPSPSTVQELEARIRELEQEIEQQRGRFETEVESARIEAREEGRAKERSERATRIEAAAQRMAETLAEFAAERDRYLAQVEQEVVRLALAIAARILHREAQMDPLLLAGAVRVALGQLADKTEVRLIVPMQERELWGEMLRLMPNLPLRPELVPEDALLAGECRLETHLGNIDLGVRSQLAEIERGFFDLLEKRESSVIRSRGDRGGSQDGQANGPEDAGN